MAIVIPEVTLDELDSKKSGFGEIAYQARSFGRLLSSAEELGIDRVGNLVISKLKVGETNLALVALNTYPDYSDTALNIINDRKIIEVAVELQKTFPKDTVQFLTNDIMCKYRAKALGVTSDTFKITEVKELTFNQTVDVEDINVFNDLDGKLVADIVGNYEPQFFNYKFTCPLTAQVKLATISEGVIQVISKAEEDELHKQDVPPINAEQLFLAKAIQDSSVDIVVVEAKAGSGKTVSAISNAIRLVKTKKYSSIVYARSSVDDVEDIEKVGYLSGNDEKMAVYFGPLEDTLDFIVRDKMKGSKLKSEERELKVQEGVTKLKEDCKIQALIGLGMRGRTFHDAILIIDEVSNLSPGVMQKMLTRVGKNSKVILIGSNNQIDNPYVNKFNNGLSYILDACTKKQETVKLHAVALHKIARGKITEFAEQLFSK